jgi:UDP-N-acetylglucosamine 2-epimerase (non-hydrolysing)
MLTIVLGTRPEIIKMSPVIRAAEEHHTPYLILHTGQHYSYEMDAAFFADLELPAPAFNLNVGSGSHGVQTGRILAGVEQVLMEMDEAENIVLVQGDTNTVMAGALAAAKLHVLCGHVEAGLRSFDRRMPEEVNRVVADHICDYLYAPTAGSAANLAAEGLSGDGVVVTGNTVVDAVVQNLGIAEQRTDVLSGLGLEEGMYVLATAHRAENVDDPNRLADVLKGLAMVGEEFEVPVVYPVHPRAEKMMKEFSLPPPDSVRLIAPLGYLEFLQLESKARMLLTDSGGVQEEACVLGVPCVTLRENTERPETVEVGANRLAGTEPGRILMAAKVMDDVSCGWANPFGDGTAGERIVAHAVSAISRAGPVT